MSSSPAEETRLDLDLKRHVDPIERPFAEIASNNCLWVLFEISCVLIYRSTIGRLRRIPENGYDGKRSPIYLRPGASYLLNQLSQISSVRIGVTTSMTPVNYKPILACIAKAAFGEVFWDEAKYPVFNRAICPPQASGATFPHGGPRMSRSLSAILQEANKMGLNCDVGRLVLVNSHPNATEGIDKASMLLVTPCGPHDIAEPSCEFSQEFDSLGAYLRELALSEVDVRSHLHTTPFVRLLHFADVEAQERDPPPLASEADFEDVAWSHPENFIQKDDVLTTIQDPPSSNEWVIRGPPRVSKVPYAWNGVRFLGMPSLQGTNSRFEVRIERGLIRVGWSTSNGLLDLGGGDRGPGFPYIGYEVTGNVCINGEHFQHTSASSSFTPGDVLTCELDRVSGEVVYKKNGEAAFFSYRFVPDARLVLYPHIAGKFDFAVKVRCTNEQSWTSFPSHMSVSTSSSSAPAAISYSSCRMCVLVWSVFQDPSTCRRWWCNPACDGDFFFEDDPAWKRYWCKNARATYYWWWNDLTQRMVVEGSSRESACFQASVIVELQESGMQNLCDQPWGACVDPLTAQKWHYNPLASNEFFFEDDITWEEIMYWDSLKLCARVLWWHQSSSRVAFGD